MPVPNGTTVPTARLGTGAANLHDVPCGDLLTRRGRPTLMVVGDELPASIIDANG